MFSPDRDPHPAIPEIKFLQQFVIVSPATNQLVTDDKFNSLIAYVSTNSKTSIKLRIVNRYCCINMSHLAWSWQVTSNRSAEPVRTGRFQLPRFDSADEVIVKLDSVVSRIRQLERSKFRGIDNTYHINIRGFLRKDMSWARSGHLLVSHQFTVKFEFDDMIPNRNPPAHPLKSMLSLESVADDNTIKVYRVYGNKRNVFVEVDRISGAIVSFSPNGKNLLREGILPNFVRAATDNDNGGSDLFSQMMSHNKLLENVLKIYVNSDSFSYKSRWKAVGLTADSPPDVVCLRTRITDTSTSERVGIVALCVVRSAINENDLFKIKLHYTIHSDGRVRISKHVAPQPLLRQIPSLPRIGLSMAIDPSYYNLNYYGKGPHENYPDRKTGSEMGVYVTTPADMAYSQYVYPVETGSRSDCEWISFRSSNGDGLCVVSTSADEELSSFSCSALLHSATELENATHTYDLDGRKNGKDQIYVSIDHKHMGLGGDCR